MPSKSQISRRPDFFSAAVFFRHTGQKFYRKWQHGRKEDARVAGQAVTETSAKNVKAWIDNRYFVVLCVPSGLRSKRGES
jgi:hypothetical protein